MLPFDMDFEIIRKELLDVLSDACDLTDDQIYEIIDGIVLEKGKISGKSFSAR